MQFNSKQNNTKVGSAYDLERKYNLSSLNQLPSMKKAIEANSIGLTKTNQEFENFVRETLQDIENLQDQIDGNITTWFYPTEPTLENAPANEWGTEKDKLNHLGDLYYDSSTGYAYRWTLEESVFNWIKLTDSDITEALAVANAAMDTADQKRRIFIVRPTPPYDVGDVWLIESGEHQGELWRCCVSKNEHGEFESSDWIVATKYTDDSTALSVKENLENFTSTVVRDYVLKRTFEETMNGFNIEVGKVKILANEKAKVFKRTPYVPYNVGDVYIDGTNIYTCINAKTVEEQYSEDDWELNLNGDDYATKSSLQIESDRITGAVETLKEVEKNVKIKQKATGNPIIIEDAGEYELEKYVKYGKSVQDGEPTPSNPSEIEVVEGVCNLYKNTHYVYNSNRIRNENITDIVVESNTQYVLNATGTNIQCNVFEYDNSSGQIKISGWKRLPYIFTTSSTTKYLLVYFRFSNDSAITLEDVSNVCMFKGDILYNYVPYGWWLKYKTCGKNSFNKNFFIDLYAHIYPSGIVSNGGNNTIALRCQPNTTYTISKIRSTRLIVGSYPTLIELSSTGVPLNNYINASTETSVSITTGVNDHYLYIEYWVNNETTTKQQVLDSIQVELGNTTTEYEEYKENSVLIDLNKENLFDINKLMQGTWNNSTSLARLTMFTKNIIPAGTEVKIKNLDTTNYQFAIGTTTKNTQTDNTEINGDSGWITDEEYTYTSLGGYIFLQIARKNGSALLIGDRMSLTNKFDMKIDNYSEDHYTLYQINDTKDAIEDNILTKRICKLILNGSENWTKYNGEFNLQTITDYKISNDNICISNYYKSVPNATGSDDAYNKGNNTCCFINSHTNYRLFIRDDRFSTVAEFKSWLESNPITIYYILEEPYEVKFEYKPLILFKGYNYITDNDKLLSDMEVEYLVDSVANSTYARKSELDITNEKVEIAVEKVDDLTQYIRHTTSTNMLHLENTVESYGAINRLTVKGFTPHTLYPNMQYPSDYTYPGYSTNYDIFFSNHPIIIVENALELMNTDPTEENLGKVYLSKIKIWGQFHYIGAMCYKDVYQGNDYYFWNIAYWDENQASNFGYEIDRISVISSIALNTIVADKIYYDKLIINSDNIYSEHNWKDGIYSKSITKSALIDKDNFKVPTYDKDTYIIVFNDNDLANLEYECEYIEKNDITSKFALNSSTKSQFRITAGEISSKVSKGDIVSEINQTPEKIKIDASKIDLNGFISANKTFTIDEEGYFSAIGGSVGGWNIDDSSLYIDKGDYRVYIQSALDDEPEDTWVFSTQEKIQGTEAYAGKFIAHLNGEVECQKLVVNKENQYGYFILPDDVCFSSGESLFNSTDIFIDLGGFLTGGSTEVSFMINLPKSIKWINVSDISLDTSTLNVRQNGKYLCSGGTWAGTTVNKTTIKKLNNHALGVQIKLNGVPTGATNNANISVSRLNVIF